MNKDSIFAIIVTYNPDIEMLQRLHEILTIKDIGTVLIDNDSSNKEEIIKNIPGGIFLGLEQNEGIAKAQNIGVEIASKNGARFFIFLDQDTQISDHFVDLIRNSFKNPSDPVIFCPVVFDKESGLEYPSLFVNKFGFITKKFSELEQNPIDISVAISSGSAVSKSVFETVGYFNEDFFIDYVDTEWFLRCKYHSIEVTVLPELKILHSIGQTNQKKRLFHSHVHSHIRVYYQIRNAIALLFLPHVPKFFAIREILITLIHRLYQVYNCDDKILYLRFLCAGIFDGLRNKLGPAQINFN